jgi:hypothetical protein
LGRSHDAPPPRKRIKRSRVAAVKPEQDCEDWEDGSPLRTNSVQPNKRTKKAPALTAPSRAGPADAVPKGAVQSAPSKPAEQCPFLELPAEIRNEIYTLALIQHGSVFVHPSIPWFLEPALLAVNRQVRFETLGLWYSDNTFAIDGSNPAVRFLRALSDQKLRALCTLRIQTTSVPAAEYIETRINQLMREFKPRGLDNQAIHFMMSVPGGFEWVNLEKLKRVVNGEEGSRMS